jgi:hypothetical protein
LCSPQDLDVAGQIETEQQNGQNEYDRSYGHGLFDHRQKIAAARKASRTPINGLETANQKETRQPDS